MSRTDKELADELDARDRLTARGYKQQTCEKCNGFGQYGSIQCWHCEGKGYKWEAPITKLRGGEEVVMNEKDSDQGMVYQAILAWINDSNEHWKKCCEQGDLGQLSKHLASTTLTTARKEEREAAKDAVIQFFGGLLSKQVNLDELLAAIEAAAKEGKPTCEQP